MAEERQLKEIDSEIYKDRTITIYLETFVINTPQGPKTEAGLTAQITPSAPALEWQGAYRQDLDEVFETCRDLIDRKSI